MTIHERVRDATQKSTGKPICKCSCGDFHPCYFDDMEINESIPKDDVTELQQEVISSKPQPALILQKEEPGSGNWGGSTY
jgi:hypothetical protein